MLNSRCASTCPKRAPLGSLCLSSQEIPRTFRGMSAKRPAGGVVGDIGRQPVRNGPNSLRMSRQRSAWLGQIISLARCRTCSVAFFGELHPNDPLPRLCRDDLNAVPARHREASTR